MLASRITRSANVRDADLERAFAARAEWAYDEAYRRFGPRLYAGARRLLQDRESVADCVQDVLLHLWKRGDAYSADRGSLEAFLATCVRNHALARLRNEGRHARRLRAIPQQSEEYEIEVDPIEQARLIGALAQLNPDQRKVVERAYFGGLTHREIAQETGAPIGTVKTRLSAALRYLRTALVPEGDRG
jgi:RNA polymerase sigma-70 factor (ECF subfamily)